MAIKQIRAQINGSWTTLNYNPGTRKYEATIAAPSKTSFNQPDHFYGVTIEATDMAGNKVTKDNTDPELGESLKLVVKETTKPTIVITSPGAGAFLTNGSVVVTAQLRDEEGGSGIAIGTLKVNLGGAVYTNTSPEMQVRQVTNGYDITLTKALPDKTYEASIAVSDNDGNAADPKTVSFTVDTVPPNLTITSPAEETTSTNESSILVTGTTSDTTSGAVKIKITNGDIVHDNIRPGSGGEFSQEVELKPGTNTIVIRATDAAGKYSEVTRTVTVDNKAPVIHSVQITPNPVNAGASFTISIEAEDLE